MKFLLNKSGKHDSLFTAVFTFSAERTDIAEEEIHFYEEIFIRILNIS